MLLSCLPKIIHESLIVVLDCLQGVSEVHDCNLCLILGVDIFHAFILTGVYLACQGPNLVPHILEVFFKCTVVALNCSQLLIHPLIFVLFEIKLLHQLICLPLQIPLSFPHIFDCALFRLHVAFSLLTSLDPRLEFKVFFFERPKLRHELTFLLYELLVAVAQLLCL